MASMFDPPPFPQTDCHSIDLHFLIFTTFNLSVEAYSQVLKVSAVNTDTVDT